MLLKYSMTHEIKNILPRPLQFDFAVMDNIFNTNLLLHRKFDLKGSKLGRTAGLRSLILKGVGSVLVLSREGDGLPILQLGRKTATMHIIHTLDSSENRMFHP
jgi:hypothetical protein